MVLVMEPSFSAAGAPGRRNTSVWTVLGSTDWSFSWTAFCLQKADVSVSNRSCTTSHSSLAKPFRPMLALGLSTAGFCPMQMNPLTLPSFMATSMCWCE